MFEENKESNDIFFNNNNADDTEQETINQEMVEENALVGINQSAMSELIKEIKNNEQPDLFNEEKREDSPLAENNFRQEPKNLSSIFFSQPNEAEYSDGSNKEVETVAFSKNKINLIKKFIKNIKENAQRVEDLLTGLLAEDEAAMSLAKFKNDYQEAEEDDGGQKIIEGVFNGQHMIGPDGKQYNVPVNYASKSKLIEGDILKLTILPNGRFLYKQIGPIDRIRIIGRLLPGNGKNEYYVQGDGHRWRILAASVTYFKGETDDEVTILIPKSGESSWAAVENIINKS